MFSIVIHKKGFYILPRESTYQDEDVKIKVLENIKFILKEGLIYFIEIHDHFSGFTKEEMWRWLRMEAKSIQVSYSQQMNRIEDTVATLDKLYKDIDNLLLIRTFMPEESNQEIIQNMASLLQNITDKFYREELLEVIQATPSNQRASIIDHFLNFFSKKSLKPIFPPISDIGVL